MASKAAIAAVLADGVDVTADLGAAGDAAGRNARMTDAVIEQLGDASVA